MKTTLLSIATPTGKRFQKNVVQINAEIAEGRIGVLAKHVPLVSSLKTSLFSIRCEDGKIEHGVVAGGIFNVTGAEVTILTIDYVFESEIDVSRAKKEIEKIKKELSNNIKDAQKKALNERLKYEELKIELKS